ncbi:TetR/AcrR family transcriptional regulator [Proteobacteria bacterium 005FR1]|nr:TetR/AcrR family transcriptional regulator [Proteobacteria bacterium 005FR1]
MHAGGLVQVKSGNQRKSSTAESQKPAKKASGTGDKKGNKDKPKAGAPRGSHQVRRAATRTRVLEAGIAILHEEGHHAATTTQVAKRAGVSRGALLHQFPTHCEMMLAIAEYVIYKNQERTARMLAKLEPGVEQFKALTDALWEKSKQPDTLALIEIHMASRSDPDLARGMGWRIKTLLDAEREKVVHMGMQAGIEKRDAITALSTLTIASIWGLSILRLDLWGDRDVAEAYELLKSNRDNFVDEHSGSCTKPND